MISLSGEFMQFNVMTRSLVGLTVGLIFTIITPYAAAQDFTILYQFQSSSDGYDPNDVIRDSAGNLYGTTLAGGTTIFGTVFKLDTSGKKTILYNFSGGTDGAEPHGALVMDSNGNLYGTTEFGGNLKVSCEGMQGCGVVFKVDASGYERVLYTFTGGADGGQPLAGLTMDDAGNLYGTTTGGGLPGCNYFAVGCGVVFKLDTSGHETVLHSFSGGTDGGAPESPLLRDSAGNLYGMTTGVNTSQGTVFKVDISGKETVLHVFSGQDGSQPYGTLLRDSNGNLYGTTYGGGDLTQCNGSGCGVVFKLSPTGKEHVLYAFTDGTDGGRPLAGLTRDKHGNLYGTSAVGGQSAYCCGVVFEVSPKGQETVLHTFTGTDGASPMTSLIQDTSGKLYGSTYGGGKYQGTLFSITLPDFAVAISPAKATVSPGQAVTSTLTLSPMAGFKGDVALTCTVPSGKGLSCGITPSSVTLDGVDPANATLSIITLGNTPAGTYKIKVLGKSGSLQHVKTFTLTVL
jgi:uncharacterized repeat protein (TIGR03803 family)